MFSQKNKKKRGFLSMIITPLAIFMLGRWTKRLFRH